MPLSRAEQFVIVLVLIVIAVGWGVQIYNDRSFQVVPKIVSPDRPSGEYNQTTINDTPVPLNNTSESVESVEAVEYGSDHRDRFGRIDLNTAIAEELETLPGIGPTLASRIIEHRNLHGPFRSASEVKDIRGIGEKKYARIKDLIVVLAEKKNGSE